MPKIPTFTAEGSMEQLAGTTSNIQVGLNNNLASALAPVTQMVVNNKIKQNDTQNRTEALRLGNEFTRKVNTLEDTIANDNTGLGVNKQFANNYYKEQTNNFISQFKSQASNDATATLFTNNALSAVNRGIFRIDTIVDKNVFKDLGNQVEQAEKSLITQALFNNKDANVVDEFGMLGNVNDFDYASLQTNLTKLYTDAYSGKIPAPNLNQMINNIPSLVQGFQVNKDIYDDPVQTYVNLNTGGYEGLTLKTREKLKKDAKLEARPILRESMDNYIVGLELNIDVPINEEAIKEVFSNKAYTDFLETKNNTIRAVETKSSIMNSKIGDEQIYIDGFELNSGNLLQDAQYKEKVKNYASIKEKLIEEDAATLILQNNPIVKDLYEDYNNEQNPEAKQILFKRYVNTVVQAQEDMGINESFIKVIPNKLAKTLVADYQENSPTGKIAYLQQLENQYGSQYGKILNQLTENGLPTTAKFVSYINDEDFAIKAMSVDTDEEKTRLDNFVKDRTDLSDSVISSSIAEGMAELRQVVTYGNKMNTTKANEQLDDMQDIIKYIAINSMSSGTKEKKAIKDAISYVAKNFVFAGDEKTIGTENTYFIPRNYNNTKLSDGQMKLIKNKASIIKSHYLKDFDMESFQSKNKDITSEELTEEMHGQAEEKGVWVNSADGSGIVFAIPFSDGSLGLVQNKNGDFLEIKFDDGTHNLPFSNILLDMKKPITRNAALNRQIRSYRDTTQNKSYTN